MKMNLTANEHDQTFSSTIKDEKQEHHLQHYFKSDLTDTNSIDQPLLIVLDEDDGNLSEENSSLNTNLSSNNELSKSSSSPPDSSLIKSDSSSKFFRRSRKSRLVPSDQSNSNKFIRTVVIGTNFMRQTRHKLHARRRNLSSMNMSNSKNHSHDSNSPVISSTDTILSKISFDNTSDILTISRMGSIFYCVEDLYMKVFASLCTLEELIDLLTKSENHPIKQVTLSEKMSIEQQISSLKKYSDTRYRLISINSSESLHKLQQLLVKIGTFDVDDEQQQHQREKRLGQIIDEMRSYKRTPTLVLLKDKVSHSPMTTKRLSSDDEDDEEEDEPRERLKIVTKKQKINESPPIPPTQFGIFIQCNGPVSCNIFSTNETVSSATTTSSTETTTTTTTVAKNDSEIIAKSTVVKKQNENTQIFFDKFPPSKSTEQANPVFHRTDSQSPTDCNQNNKFASSNMPIKRRILNSYATDSTTVSTAHAASASINSSRCLYRSKSLSSISTCKKDQSRRSTSVPPMAFHFPSTRTLPIREAPTSKSKSEPIDLTDGSYSMPMIVNVEENVDFNSQRQKINSKRTSLPNRPKASPIIPIPSNPTTESRVPPPVISRSISHPSDSSPVTKPIPLHPQTPSSYRPSSYAGYHQDSYPYRDTNQTTAQSSSIPSHAYAHSNNNGNPYPYPYPTSAQYQSIKKSRDSFSSLPASAVSNPFDNRSNSVGSMHPSPSPNPNSASNVVMPIVRKPNYYHQLTPEQQASIKMQSSPPTATPCRLPCCYQPHTNMSTHSSDKSFVEERTIYRHYASAQTPQVQTFKREPSQTPDIANSPSSLNRKQRRIEPIPPTSSTPYPYYPQAKSYFVPPQPPSQSPSTSHWPPPPTPPSNANVKPSIRYPYPPPSATPMNGMPRKMEPYPQPRRPTPAPSRAPAPPLPPTSAPVVVQNSSTLISPPNTPHELTLPNIRTRSVDLQRAIAERGYCDVDKLPKLVVRHTKIYPTRSVDTMGQLFPTWFNEPDYRCIHCFRCDQVFTPQQFMTHVDDEVAQNEQPSSMTSIQLLTSEKMSEYKVGLWNQFCTNLTIYAREGRIGGFSTNRNV